MSQKILGVIGWPVRMAFDVSYAVMIIAVRVVAEAYRAAKNN